MSFLKKNKWLVVPVISYLVFYLFSGIVLSLDLLENSFSIGLVVFVLLFEFMLNVAFCVYVFVKTKKFWLANAILIVLNLPFWIITNFQYPLIIIRVLLNAFILGICELLHQYRNFQKSKKD